MQIIFILVYVLLSVSGVILIKLGSNVSTSIYMLKDSFGFKIGWISLAGLLCYVLSFLCYMNLISKYNLSYIVPIITGITYFLIFASSILIFKEDVTKINMFGSFIILVGVVLVNMK